ncbi:hypothetical protein [Endozoicomonas sp. 8E]|uniref:hypothetical protein n=1 Tax=Endozoicomonas sp. 8E TaxID=3035692 RepID=UPI00293943C2|nr:hypothetical protein [Endozoicomonas sp. 8E]WOG26802.1 hypothetical protein P6910_19975 [Endozoicomonas sp. 8E]
MSVICQAKPLTRRFIIELEQNAGFPNQNFSIKIDRRTLSGSLPDIADTNGCEEPDLPPDKKRHKPDSYRVKTTLVESISWQWLYTTNLPFTYELFLTSRDIPLCSKPYSWILVEAVITVGWLLKSNWNPDSLLFKPIEQHEASQSHLLAITAMMPGSEHEQQGQPAESSGQQAPRTDTYPKDYFTNLLYSDSGDDSGNPQQHSHTLGLNCFVFPCSDVCQFRQSSDASDSGAPDCRESSTNHEEAGPGRPCLTDTNTPARQATCNVIVFGKDGQLRQCERIYKNKKMLQSHKSRFHSGQKTCDLMVIGEGNQSQPCGKVFQNARGLTNHKSIVHSGQKNCNETIIGKDGQPQPCGKICSNARSLTVHKSRYHTGQKTCAVTDIGEDGQQRPCGKVCKNALALTEHKSKRHTGQKTCNLSVAGEDGQPRPCGMVCQNAMALSNHKRNFHSRQQTCTENVTRDDGQLRLCGTICKNIPTLSYHKRREHSGLQACKVNIVGEDGQKRHCGKVCKNPDALSNHKRRDHSGQKICDVTIIEDNGQLRPCAKVCKNAKALSDHKSRYHTGQQICDLTVIGHDGQPQLCRKVFKNAKALLNHKGIHRKRKPFDVDRDTYPIP